MPVHHHCVPCQHLEVSLNWSSDTASCPSQGCANQFVVSSSKVTSPFQFHRLKSFSQNWQKKPQTKNQFTLLKMQLLQVWVEKGKRCCVQGELQEEQREEDCLLPNSWNMDYTKRSKSISNLMVFTSDLHNQAPTQSRSHPSDSWLLKIPHGTICRPPHQVLLLTFWWWGLTQRELILSGLRHSQCAEKATANKICRTLWNRCAHLKMWRMKETIMSTVEEQPLPRWQVAIRRPAFTTSPAKTPFITWSQFTAAPDSLKTISDGF